MIRGSAGAVLAQREDEDLNLVEPPKPRNRLVREPFDGCRQPVGIGIAGFPDADVPHPRIKYSWAQVRNVDPVPSDFG